MNTLPESKGKEEDEKEKEKAVQCSGKMLCVDPQSQYLVAVVARSEQHEHVVMLKDK
jgi:hypothetical protein